MSYFKCVLEAFCISLALVRMNCLFLEPNLQLPHIVQADLYLQLVDLLSMGMPIYCLKQVLFNVNGLLKILCLAQV